MLQELGQEIAKIELNDWQQALIGDVLDSFREPEPVLWIVLIPRRHGKTTVLLEIGKRLVAAGIKVGVLAATTRGSSEFSALGIETLDFGDSNRVLLVDDFETNKFSGAAYVIANGIQGVLTTSSPEAYASAVKRYPKALRRNLAEK